VLYNYKTERPVFQRLRYNPDYPFKCVVCPECGEPLKGSAPKGRNTHYPQYHCARGHKSFAVSRDQMDETVEEFLSKTEYSDDYLKVIESLLVRRLRQKQADIVQESKTLNERVALLKSEQEKMLRVLLDTESDAVRKMFETQLEEKQLEIRRAESYRFTVDLSEADVQELIIYARKIVESPEKTLIDKDNPLRQEQLFKLFFHGLPTYSELASGTAKKRFLFNRNCISETPPEGGESHQGRLPGIDPLFLIRYAHKNAGRGSPIFCFRKKAENMAPPFDSRTRVILITRLVAQIKSPHAGNFLFGRLPGIEPGRPAPQTGVLPLNYSRQCVVVLAEAASTVRIVISGFR
jgi:hypothetical protein